MSVPGSMADEKTERHARLSLIEIGCEAAADSLQVGESWTQMHVVARMWKGGYGALMTHDSGKGHVYCSSSPA